MAYTRAWSESIPPGSAPANQLDTFLQNIRTDIRERLGTIFGLDFAEFSADPIVPESLTLSDYIAIGSTAATAGAVRLQNNAEIMGRNAANSNNYSLLKVDNANTLVLGESGLTNITIANLTRFNGNVGFGIDPAANTGIYFRNTLTQSASKTGVFSVPIGNNSATTSFISGFFALETAASAIVVGTAIGVQIGSITLGAGTSVTNQYGLFISNIATGTTTNFSIFTGTGIVSFGDQLVVRANGASITGAVTTTSTITIPNATTYRARNATNTGNINIVQVDANNDVVLGNNPYWIIKTSVSVGDLFPSAHNTYNIGATGTRVLNGWFSGTVTAATFDGAFTGSGASLTNLNATQLTTGTVPDARFPATLPAISGVNLTNLNASNLASGTVPDARFPAILPALSGINLTNLNATNLASGTVASARISGSYTGITGTGALDAGSITSNFGSINIGTDAITGGNINGTTITASTGFSGPGSSITALNATQLTSGTVPDARFPATLPAISGANLTNLNASSIASGSLADGRLSSNVVLENAANAFTSTNSFIAGSRTVLLNTTDGVNVWGIQVDTSGTSFGIKVVDGSIVVTNAGATATFSMSPTIFSANNKINVNTTGISFYGASPIAKPTVTGSRGGNAALASLCTELANLGLITNSTS